MNTFGEVTLKKNHLLIIVLLSFLLMLALTGNAQTEPVTVRVAMSQPENLDPVSLSRFDVHERDMAENLWIGLTRLDPRTGQIEPQLVTEWSISPDGLSWTFRLRDDIQWVEVRDGEPITLRPVVASDIVFAIQRACDPNRPSPVTANMSMIVGCLDIANRTDTWNINPEFLDQYVGVQVVDDQTVSFQLLYPAAYFLTMTTLPEFRPLPPEYVVDPWPIATNIVTSGPWIVAQWDGGQMQLETNPFWPLEREGNIELVDIRFDVPDEALPVRLTSGAIDVARLDAAAAQTVRLGNAATVHATDGQTLFLVGFSFEHPPLDNPLVRQALAQSIDREQLAAQLSSQDNVEYRAVSQFTPRNVVAAPGTSGLTFDPAVAQNALASAGYPGCANFPSTTIMLVVEDTDLAITIGQFVVQQWAQNLGCSGIFEVGTATRQTLIDSAHATIDASEESEVTRFQAWLVTWTADYPDANAWTSDALHCQFGFLRVGRVCDVSDTLLDQAGTMLDFADRSTVYGQAEQRLFGTGGTFPAVPLVLTQTYWAQQTWVSNIADYGSFQFDYWQVATE